MEGVEVWRPLLGRCALWPSRTVASSGCNPLVLCPGMPCCAFKLHTRTHAVQVCTGHLRPWPVHGPMWPASASVVYCGWHSHAATSDTSDSSPSCLVASATTTGSSCSSSATSTTATIVASVALAIAAVAVAVVATVAVCARALDLHLEGGREGGKGLGVVGE